MEVAGGSYETRSLRSARWKCLEFNLHRILISATLVLALFHCAATEGQITSVGPQASASQNQSRPEPAGEFGVAANREGETELQTGSALTSKGSFREAIPHLLAARGRVTNEYAASFNLALCYVGTDQFRNAIQTLNELRIGHDDANVENLLAQAYIGNGQPPEALASLQKAAILSPRNEKLFAFVADACMDHRDYRLGLQVVDIGLGNLPQSARLHYERAMFLTQLDHFDRAKPEFELAGRLAPESDIGYLAMAQKELFAGDVVEAMGTARRGVKQGDENPALLTVLGEALIRSGIGPGQPEFMEAQDALEKAVVGHPTDPTSQIALGQIYLLAGRLDEAIMHLEMARDLEPDKPSIYANLAKAYQRRGDAKRAQDALAVLEKLNQEQANRINSAPGDRKLGYAGGALPQSESATPRP